MSRRRILLMNTETAALEAAGRRCCATVLTPQTFNHTGDHQMAQPASRATIKVLPSARRLILSLRDIGYDFVHAVADLVDNSIAAEASTVTIDVCFAGVQSWLRVADDGIGMSAATITEAMRYGSQRPYGTDDDLGKFGLGLKTASMSQCRRLSVASRTGNLNSPIQVRILDLDHIEQTDEWEVLVAKPSRCDALVVEPLQYQIGTVVLWQSLDRVLGYKLPSGERARNGLAALTHRLHDHLGMVFHRFLAGEIPRRRKLTITINGTKVEAWDPFARDEPATEVLPVREFEVRTPTGVGLVRLRPFVLPRQDRFSSEAAFMRAGGPGRWNSQQGLYIYRANRMIQSGGWSRLRTSDEHSKLARAALDFHPDLDSAFEVNVAKARVNLPADLRERLRDPIDDLARWAQRVYRQRDRATPSIGRDPRSRPEVEAAESRSPSPDQYLPDRDASSDGADVTRINHQGHGRIRTVLEDAAREAGEYDSLQRIIAALRTRSPRLADELGW